ncbi:hypothetical protein MMC30_000336 [Trapelia coarctata]|nr:hypothetical protein [Trapelia coarctata]
MVPHASEPQPTEENTSVGVLKKPPQLLMAAEEESRPQALRRSTEPDMATTSPFQFNKPLPLRSRNRSPYARAHVRSRSSASSLTSPPMVHAHSSPIVDTFGHVHMAPNARPSSPLFVPSRRQSPLRRPLEETYPTLEIDQTISETQELDLTPRPQQDSEGYPNSPLSIHYTFPRSRRRPSSPLYHLVQSPSFITSSPLHTSSSSPTLATKFNESYPSSLSSVPSTPTSFRSRSPSISSLETIPDSPDAEEAAQEADMVARLKAAAEREESGEADGDREGRFRRGSLDVPGRGSGGVLGLRDKRKRWSVCGAERRGDLDLETIWED